MDCDGLSQMLACLHAFCEDLRRHAYFASLVREGFVMAFSRCLHDWQNRYTAVVGLQLTIGHTKGMHQMGRAL